MPVIAKEQNIQDHPHVDGDEILWPPVMVPAGHYEPKKDVRIKIDPLPAKE